MKPFHRSVTARVFALSFSIALGLGGISALMARGPASTFVFAASLFVPVVVTFVATALAVQRYWYEVVLAVISLPMLLLFWAVGIGVIREFHVDGLALLAIACGLAALGFAARPAEGLGLRDQLAPNPTGLFGRAQG